MFHFLETNRLKVWNDNAVALQIRAGQWSTYSSLLHLIGHIYHVMIIVAGGFSKIFSLIIFRGSRKQMFFKTGIVRNVTIFRRKPRPKRDFNTNSFLKILRNFCKQIFLQDTSPDAFVSFIKWLLNGGNLPTFFLNQNKKWRMVSIKKICRSGQGMLFTHY